METYVDATFGGSWKEKGFLLSPGKEEQGQIHLAIWTNTFNNFNKYILNWDKYILILGQIH